MELPELGITPITADAPAGEDPRYLPAFEQLQSEVEKLSSPAGGCAPDWEKAVTLAAEVLEKHSKDLLAASYLSVALIHTRRLEGFSLGLKKLSYAVVICHGMDDGYKL